jgi:hypothetical protein
MGAGDVEVRIVAAQIAAVDTALTAMRVTAGANGKYMCCSIANGLQVMLIAITE